MSLQLIYKLFVLYYMLINFAGLFYCIILTFISAIGYVNTGNSLVIGQYSLLRKYDIIREICCSKINT
jgi:hypothetical protein